MPEGWTKRSYEYERIPDQTSQDIYEEKEDQKVCRIYGLKRSWSRSLFYHIFSILVLGVPYVIFKSYPKVKSRVKYKTWPVQDAELFLIRDNHGNYTVQEVAISKINIPRLGFTDVKYFFHQKTKYVWVPDRQGFGIIDNLVPILSADEYLEDTGGLGENEYSDLLQLYGPNKIEVEIKSYWKLFIEEIFNAFYLFQAFSVILWCVDDYFIYAACVVVLTLFSSVTSLLQTRKQSQNLHDIVESSKCHEASVLRRSFDTETRFEIDPERLVPGDLIVLPASDYVMPCDAVLLTGQCIVNESVLTGESVPVTKTSLHSGSEKYDSNTHKRNTLFSGTHILQTRYYGGENVLATVVRTGFDTTKGRLVKSILFPSPVNLQFYRDSLKFVFVLFTIAASGMVFCLYLYVERHATIEEILLRTLDIITIVVPPALPAAMAVGTVYSQGRLKKLKIYCISPPRINVCGKIKLACFDKTGTLTHDGLHMSSAIPCVDGVFREPITDISLLQVKNKFVQGMATCHSLTRIGGKLNGDPLDLNMFEFTKWTLEEPGSIENERYDMLAPTVVSPPKKVKQLKLNHEEGAEYEVPYQIGLIREFSFSSTLQCMSVICKDLETPSMMAFTKGAPEKLFGLCLPETLPSDFQERLSYYTANGFRVIALAYKNLPHKFKWKDAQKAKRDMIECDLNFLGLLVLQNPLKDETIPVLRELHRGNIRTVMITGDNIMTAISVARDCGMVNSHDDIYILNVTENENINETSGITVEKVSGGSPSESVAVTINNTNCHFAMDGRSWSRLKFRYPDLIPGLLVRTTVFARFQPDQKTQLVTAFQDLDYIVSMVGDGANDCGALKAAHVGVSLSPAEASVAAPFTSGIPNISCLVWLMLEGRCALITSFAIFKYMALYSLIQFFTILILYKCHSILGDFQFLFIDLVITTSLAVTMGNQGPSKVLCPKRPMSSLISPKNLVPLILQIAACAFFQLGSLYFLYRQDWFEPIPSDKFVVTVSWENTVLFTVSCFQYVILAWHFSKGKPYRKTVFTNFWFIVSVVSLTALTVWLTLNPCKTVAELMDLIYVSPKDAEHMRFKYYLLAFPVAHFLLAGFIEKFLSESWWLKKLFQLIKFKRQPKNKYKRLLQDQSFVDYLRSLEAR